MSLFASTTATLQNSNSSSGRGGNDNPGLPCPSFLISCGDENRLQSALAQLARVNIVPHVVTCELNAENGALGCLQAHKDVMAYVIQQQTIENFVVFEDNVCTTRRFDGDLLFRTVQQCMAPPLLESSEEGEGGAVSTHVLNYVSLSFTPNVRMEKRKQWQNTAIYTRKRNIRCEGTRAYFGTLELAKHICSLPLSQSPTIPIDRSLARYWATSGPHHCSFIMYPCPFARSCVTSKINKWLNIGRAIMNRPRMYSFMERVDHGGFTSVGVIIGVVVAVLLFIGVLLFSLSTLRRRKRQKL